MEILNTASDTDMNIKRAALARFVHQALQQTPTLPKEA